MTRASLVLGLAVLAGGVPAGPAPLQKDMFVKVYTPDGRTLTAELALTPEARSRGLMFLEKLLPGQGMLFVFEKEGLYSFWMKNTLLPLDVLWLDGGRRVVHIESNAPPCPADPCPSYSPSRPALYVLELAAGGARLFDLKLFDRLEFKLPPGSGRST